MDILSRPIPSADHRIPYGSGPCQFGDLWLPQPRGPGLHEVYGLMGGRPQDLPDRYQAGNPGDLLPFHVPQLLLQGTADDQIPPDLPGRWAERARRLGDTANVKIIPSADHFDVVDPESGAWGTVREWVRKVVFR